MYRKSIKNSKCIILIYFFLDKCNSMSLLQPYEESTEPDINFLLYTKVNPEEPQQIHPNLQSTLSKSNFNSRNPTRFIIHGWQGNENSLVNHELRKAYFNRGNFNIFVVDWSSDASSVNYADAKQKAETVGKNIAKFIDFLNASGGMSFRNLYVIGHSLGAHVAGFTGKFTKRGRVNTIFGLDPAWPLFTIDSPETRLAKTDAEYVETIQTNGELQGFYEPIGTASFYPNWGKSQPGCGKDILGACAHARAYEYFAESVASTNNNQFVAVECVNLDEIRNHKCSGTRKNLRMGGEPSNYRNRINGVYYLPTNSKSPFGIRQNINN